MRKITIPIVTEIVKRFKPVTYWLTVQGADRLSTNGKVILILLSEQFYAKVQGFHQR